MPQELLSIRKVAARISHSTSWIYAKMKVGRFPRPLPLEGIAKNLWSSEQLDSWIASRMKDAK